MNALFKTILGVLLSLLWMQTSNAGSLSNYEQVAPAFLASIKKVKIYLEDQVTDGCLPNPKRLKEKMEITLRKNGISVDDENLSDAAVEIMAFGYKSNKMCAVYIKTSAVVVSNAEIPHSKYTKPNTTAFINYRIPMGAALLTGPDMQRRLTLTVEEHADSLSLEIFRARETEFKYR